MNRPDEDTRTPELIPPGATATRLMPAPPLSLPFNVVFADAAPLTPSTHARTPMSVVTSSAPNRSRGLSCRATEGCAAGFGPFMTAPSQHPIGRRHDRSVVDQPTHSFQCYTTRGALRGLAAPMHHSTVELRT